MRAGSWYELNVSTSDTVRVTISALEKETQTMFPIFNQTGTHFTQIVETHGNGTYHVEIKNEGSHPVNIETGSNVFAKEMVKKYRTVYLYPTQGALIALLGATLLIFGILTKPKKYLKSKKDRAKRKI